MKERVECSCESPGLTNVPKTYVGLSGWNYRHWKDTFYKGVSSREWLAFASRQVQALEVNATFYRRQKRETLEKWRTLVPEGFPFILKVNRYLTHTKRLTELGESVLGEREVALGLGSNLKIALWQLPPSFAANIERLESFAFELNMWPEVAHAIEFRHKSWFKEEVAVILERHRIANCISHSARWPMWNRATGPLAYARLHGAPRTYWSPYSNEELQQWAEKAHCWNKEGRDAYVLFDNDAAGFAPDNAARLIELLA